jgi:hypothetical protein
MGFVEVVGQNVLKPCGLSRTVARDQTQDAAGYHGALTSRTIEAKDKEVYIDN